MSCFNLNIQINSNNVMITVCQKFVNLTSMNGVAAVRKYETEILLPQVDV